MQSQTQAHALASESSLGITGAPGASAQVGRHLMVNGTLAGQKQSASSSLSAVSSVAPRSRSAKTSSSGVMKGVVEGWWNASSKNGAVNEVFQRLHAPWRKLIVKAASSQHMSQMYPTPPMPRLGASTPRHRLSYPPVELPAALATLFTDATPTRTVAELAAVRTGRLPSGVAKLPPEPGYPEQPVFHSQRFRDVLASAIDEVCMDEDCRAQRAVLAISAFCNL